MDAERPLQKAIARLEQMENLVAASAFVAANAVGIWIDNPDDPQVAVAVHDGRIVYIGISDPMMRGGLPELQDALNCCIFNAFAAWHHKRAGANPVLGESG